MDLPRPLLLLASRLLDPAVPAPSLLRLAAHVEPATTAAATAAFAAPHAPPVLLAACLAVLADGVAPVPLLSDAAVAHLLLAAGAAAGQHPGAFDAARPSGVDEVFFEEIAPHPAARRVVEWLALFTARVALHAGCALESAALQIGGAAGCDAHSLALVALFMKRKHNLLSGEERARLDRLTAATPPQPPAYAGVPVAAAGTTELAVPDRPPLLRPSKSTAHTYIGDVSVPTTRKTVPPEADALDCEALSAAFGDALLPTALHGPHLPHVHRLCEAEMPRVVAWIRGTTVAAAPAPGARSASPSPHATNFASLTLLSAFPSTLSFLQKAAGEPEETRATFYNHVPPLRDTAAATCAVSSCDTHFGLVLSRRGFCHYCGRALCPAHLSRRYPVPHRLLAVGDARPQPLCDACFRHLSAPAESVFGDLNKLTPSALAASAGLAALLAARHRVRLLLDFFAAECAALPALRALFSPEDWALVAHGHAPLATIVAAARKLEWALPQERLLKVHVLSCLHCRHVERRCASSCADMTPLPGLNPELVRACVQCGAFCHVDCRQGGKCGTCAVKAVSVAAV